MEYNNIWVLYPGSEKDICYHSLTKQPEELNKVFANCPLLKQHLITENKEKPLKLPLKINSILSSSISCDDNWMYKQVGGSFLSMEYLTFLLNLYF